MAYFLFYFFYLQNTPPLFFTPYTTFPYISFISYKYFISRISNRWKDSS